MSDGMLLPMVGGESLICAVRAWRQGEDGAEHARQDGKSAGPVHDVAQPLDGARRPYIGRDAAFNLPSMH